MRGSRRSARLRIAGSVLLTLLAAGCANRSPPPPDAQAAPLATAPSGPVSVDGTYDGTKQKVRGGDGPGLLCGQLDPFSVTVTNRSFQYVLQQPEVPFQPTRTFDVTIQPDGSFMASSGPTYIDGSAGGGAMQGEISGDACGYVFNANRRRQ